MSAPEKLVQIIENSPAYGYEQYAFFDIDKYLNEGLLGNYFLGEVVICLMTNSPTLLALGTNSRDISNFYLDVIAGADGKLAYPKPEVINVANPRDDYSYSVKIAAQHKIPLAIFKFLENRETGNILLLLDIFQGATPSAVLNSFKIAFGEQNLQSVIN
jgi:hypothetical protein